MLARLIYGFRISVLFGLILTVCQLGHRHRRRRGAGLFRRLGRSLLPALHRDLVGLPTLYPADHPLQRRRRRASGGCSASCCCSAGRRWSAWCAPSSCARATSTTCAPPARSACGDWRDHVPPRAAQRHGRDADLPALHPQRLGHDADRRSTSSASACRRARRRSASC